MATNTNTNTTNSQVVATNVSTCLDANMDLFFIAGASRNLPESKILALFEKAQSEDSDIFLRLVNWARDVRGGAGERRFYRLGLKFLAKTNHPKTLDFMEKTPELGRWDDLFVVFETDNVAAHQKALEMIDTALKAGNGLCAKWMPRDTNKKARVVATKIRNHMGLDPRAYRKLIVGLSNTVEQAMCAGNWDQIEYGKIPSVASARYRSAFGRHDYEGYNEYLGKVEKGEAKINADAVFPHDVIRECNLGWGGINVSATAARAMDAQWNALPDYLAELDDKVAMLPMCDVSGSMATGVGSGNLTCMHVAMGLTVYLAERNQSFFKDYFITFSERPKLHKIVGKTIVEKLNNIAQTAAYSTNINAAFKMLLAEAVKNNVSADDMPKSVVILSDMAFNCGSVGGLSHHESIKKQYAQAGYTMPNVVYWNINAQGGGAPVKYDEKGVALVSGFSPSIAKMVLSGNLADPTQIMLKTISNERYKV